MEPITTTVSDCARCNGTHENLEFKPLTNHPIDGFTFTHWAICPTMDEPLLLKLVQTD